MIPLSILLALISFFGFRDQLSKTLKKCWLYVCYTRDMSCKTGGGKNKRQQQQHNIP
jgi:hypothetical protein